MSSSELCCLFVLKYVRLVKGHHGGGDVAGGDDVGLGLECRLDDLGVEGVGDQGDDNIVLGNNGIKGSLVVHIQGDGGGVVVASGKLLGNMETAGSYLTEIMCG